MKLTSTGMQPIVCRFCGGSEFEKVPGELNWYKCQFCGKLNQLVNYDPSNQDVTPQSLLEKAYLELKTRDFSNAEKDFRRVLDRAPGYASAWFGIVLAQHNCIDSADLSGDVMTNRYLFTIEHGETYTYCPMIEDIRNHIIQYLGNNMNRALETQNIIDQESFEQVLSDASKKTMDKYAKQKYDYGVRLCSNEKREDYLIACRVFRELGSYWDSTERYQECLTKLKNLKYGFDDLKTGHIHRVEIHEFVRNLETFRLAEFESFLVHYNEPISGTSIKVTWQYCLPWEKKRIIKELKRIKAETENNGYAIEYTIKPKPRKGLHGKYIDYEGSISITARNDSRPSTMYERSEQSRREIEEQRNTQSERWMALNRCRFCGGIIGGVPHRCQSCGKLKDY